MQKFSLGVSTVTEGLSRNIAKRLQMDETLESMISYV